MADGAAANRVRVLAIRAASLAHAALKETLKTMSARVIEEASIVVPLDGRAWDANDIATDADLSTALRDALAVLAREVPS